jgi:hypothetical protein
MGGAGALLLLGTAPDAVAQVAAIDPLAAQSVLAKDPPIVVEPGEDTLHDAVEEAESGDTLLLEPGLYVLTHTVLIEKDLTIKGASGHTEDVNIVAVAEDFDLLEGIGDADPLDWGHLLFVRAPAEKIVLKDFTIKGAPEIEAITEEFCEATFGLNHSECMGDAIHIDGVAEVEIEDVEASLNAGNGIWIDGAEKASFKEIVGVNNGAFGIDVDTALDLSIRRSTFIANQVSGIEASGHEFGVPRHLYTAKVLVKETVAKGNGEIGVEVERFKRARIDHVTCADNREDGFDADRVGTVQIDHSDFINNLDDAIELFPAGSEVPPEEQPADFPGSIFEDFNDLDFSGNVGEEINRPPTEN